MCRDCSEKKRGYVGGRGCHGFLLALPQLIFYRWMVVQEDIAVDGEAVGANLVHGVLVGVVIAVVGSVV